MIESETLTKNKMNKGLSEKKRLSSKPGTAEVGVRMQLTIDSTVPVEELSTENLNTQSELN